MQFDKRFREFRPIPPEIQTLPRGGKAEKAQCFQGFFQIYKEKPPGKALGLGPSPQGKKALPRGETPLYYNSIGSGRKRGGRPFPRAGGQDGEGRGKSPGKSWGAVRRRKTKGPRPLPQPLCQRISSLKKPEKSASRQREVPVPLTRPSIMPVYKLVKGNL